MTRALFEMTRALFKLGAIYRFICVNEQEQAEKPTKVIVTNTDSDLCELAAILFLSMLPV